MKARCEFCGEPAKPTPLGSLLCPACVDQWREYHCGRCGVRVMYRAEEAANYPSVAARICSICEMADRAAALAEVDRKAILSAVTQGNTLAAIIEIRRRLGWSIGDAQLLVNVLRDS